VGRPKRRKAAARASQADPAPAPPIETLPHPLTFFLSEGERQAVLARLRRCERDRTRALLGVLGIQRTSGGHARD
jgi:hypothetical protein